MIKVLFTWKKNPNLTEEQQENHYIKIHTPIAKKALGTARRYSQHKVLKQTVYNQAGEAIEVKPEFDRFVVLWFDSREAMEQAFASPDMVAANQDQKNFMDETSIKIYEIDETIVI
jgi:uncharacterized protein (TIGR02118 family)